MNTSTEGVTLYAGFLFDLARCYEAQSLVSNKLLSMAKRFSPERPNERAPMQLYNDMCNWIESELGPASVRKAGVAASSRAYDHITREPAFPNCPKPLQILTALSRVVRVMIQDPEGRGWEIRSSELQRVLMRRTQTFNCILQEGLLEGLVSRAGCSQVAVVHSSCDRKHAPFCEYAISWQ